MNLVEIHVLQSVPPANLNRDDTGSPKDAMFGNARRARISSQAQKRAVRQYFREFLQPEETALRSRRVIDALVERMADRAADEVRLAALQALHAMDLGTESDGRTKYLLFLGRRELDRLADIVRRHWDVLLEAAVDHADQSGKQQKKKGSAKDRLPKAVVKELEDILTESRGGKAVDVALFGRMLADRPEWGVEAACQVAHAISTHRVDREFDFFTAVDDLNPREDTGAGMMGDVEYYAATFYRYANVNLDLLRFNLQDDGELALRATRAFLEAFVRTLPRGKQNTFAAHTLPGFVAVLARGNASPCNLAVAFEKPVWASDGRSIMGASVERLLEYWQRLERVYGRPEPEWGAMINVSDGTVSYRQDALCEHWEGALDRVMTGARALLGVG